MKNVLSMLSGRRLLMAYLLGVAACAAQATEGSNDISNGSLANRQDDAPGTGAANCAYILEENCRAKPSTDAQIRDCEQSKQERHRECLRTEACLAQLDVAVAACGTKPAENSPNRPTFDACVRRALDALNACTGATGP